MKGCIFKVLLLLVIVQGVYSKSALLSALGSDQPAYAKEIFITVARVRGQVDEIVGFIAGYLSLHDSTLADIITHFVQKNARRKNIGWSMHELTVSELKAISITHIMTIIPDPDETESGKRFVESMGYKNATPEDRPPDPSDFLLTIDQNTLKN